MLAVSSATADGTVKVAVSGKWPKGRTQVLTSGGAFSSKSVELAAGAPRWAQGVRVNEDGNIVLDVKPMTVKVIVK